MAGNVLEWVADYYAVYPATPQVDPFVATPMAGGPNVRLRRGGAYHNTGTNCRTTARHEIPKLWNNPESPDEGNTGFRVCK